MSEPALQLHRAPAPALRPGGHHGECWSAVTALTLHAIDLAEDRRFRDRPAKARLEMAIDEQRGFLEALLAPDAAVVYDLRLVARPEDTRLLTAGVVIRSWADGEAEARARVLDLARGALRCVPDHVALKPATDAELSLLRDPLDSSSRPLHAAFVTREEVTGRPVRADVRKQIDYHYSVLPWTFSYTDWTPIYAQLSTTTQPLVLSVALLPRRTDPELAAWLDAYAASYGLWSTPGRVEGLLYSGTQLMGPETFAVDAAPTFAEYAKRLRTQSVAMRILLASTQPLAAGLPHAIGATVSSPGGSVTDGVEGARSLSGYAVRDRDVGGLAAWDLEAVDVCTPGGDPRIWGNRYPPPPPLIDLAILGDTLDAACAFRLPIAHDRNLPGLPVRRRPADPGPQPEASGGGSGSLRRVFLCHSSADKEQVRALYRRLVEDGFSPWLDEEDLLAGEDWELAIDDAVRAVDFVVVCLSNASATRAGYVHKEIKQALDVADQQPEGTTFVIPVRLEACALPRRLRHLHCVDIFVEGGYARLTQALNRGPKGPPPD